VGGCQWAFKSLRAFDPHDNPIINIIMITTIMMMMASSLPVPQWQGCCQLASCLLLLHNSPQFRPSCHWRLVVSLVASAAHCSAMRKAEVGARCAHAASSSSRWLWSWLCTKPHRGFMIQRDPVDDRTRSRWSVTRHGWRWCGEEPSLQRFEFVLYYFACMLRQQREL
jgi:hypothetical protein